MMILPVLDLLGGEVVRGVAGRRQEYRPLVSRLVRSTAPLDVARALRDEFGFSRLYVADLDGILHTRVNWGAISSLRTDGFQLLVDAGCRDVETAARLSELGCDVVVGLESSPSPSQIAELGTAARGITFSLDLQNGRPMLADGATGWSRDPREIVRRAVNSGITRLIVLDLADVGMANGTRTTSLCRDILAEFPNLHLTCGGGVRSVEELREWGRFGVRQVLVASALHDGRLTGADLAEFPSG